MSTRAVKISTDNAVPSRHHWVRPWESLRSHADPSFRSNGEYYHLFRRHPILHNHDHGYPLAVKFMVQIFDSFLTNGQHITIHILGKCLDKFASFSEGAERNKGSLPAGAEYGSLLFPCSPVWLTHQPIDSVPELPPFVHPWH